jgi:hypothetical protein
MTGGSPGTLQVAALPGALATPFVYPLPYREAYLYIACLPSRHPYNQQPFLRETCSPLHAISIVVLLLARS